MTLMRPALVLLAAVAIAACANVGVGGSQSASKSGTSAHHLARIKTASVPKSPPAGSRAQASALATKLLSRLRLPAGARRLPPDSAPRSIPASLWFGAAASIDVHELFELPEPMNAAAAFMSAHVPLGTSRGVTGQSSGPPGATMADVSYSALSVPDGVNAAQLSMTIVPDVSGGSLLRVDAQVIWYPPRTTAEYIDAARYKALTVAVTDFNPRLHTISKVVTSQAAIVQLANALNRSRVEPITFRPSCPVIFATYRLGFAVALHRKPVVVVTATKNSCLGVQISVDGRKQPALQDEATIVALADRLLGVTPRP